MRIASIDLGTNTLLLLIADIDNNGIMTPIYHEQQIPRLGKNVDATKHIDQSMFRKISDIIASYQKHAVKLHTDKIVAAGTSSLRDAANKQELIEYIRSETGIILEVLSGEQEALLTYRGAISGLREPSTSYTVIDIGGGSTEITFPDSGNPADIKRYSLDIGAVRITERHFLHNPPLPAEGSLVKNLIAKAFGQIPDTTFSQHQLVGVAGTVTTLACLDQSLTEFDVGKISGYVMSADKVDEWCRRLSTMSSAEILALSNTAKGREDILFAGVVILREFMNRYDLPSIRVSERGLRYGLVLREWDQTAALS